MALKYGMRVRCECGRRLFDVTRQQSRDGRYRDLDYNPGYLTVRARPGVRIRKWHREPGMRGTTYTAICPGLATKCGRSHSKTAHRLWAIWQERHAQDKLVEIVLGIDM